jgi:hypothetical protein
MTTLKKAALILFGFALLVPAFSMAHEGDHTTAQAGAGVHAQAQVNTPGASVRAAIVASTTAETTRAARAKEKAAQEIDRRIAALNALLVRVTAMKKVSELFKTNLKTNVENQISVLTALRAKIDADTDLAVLKEDIASITSNHRIYMLVIPQGRILTAADRAATTINMMAGLGAKLQARIQAEKDAGRDTASLEATLVAFAAKLDSAAVHAQTAVTLIAPLTPDEGVASAKAANEKALKDAHAEIKAAHTELVAARQDIAVMVSGLAKLRADAAAGTTTGAGAQ